MATIADAGDEEEAMPTMNVRSAAEVPRPARGAKANREAQQQYEQFIQAIKSDVGELELSSGENPRGVKGQAPPRRPQAGREIDIWDVDGRVYFRIAAKRGRPRTRPV
jgi:hypothetical protein